MGESSLSQDHFYVARCAGESAIDPAVKQAAEVQRECRNAS